MKTHTDYQSAKVFLKLTAKTAKSEYKNDKPAQRMIINDTVDFLCKNYQYYEIVLIKNQIVSHEYFINQKYHYQNYKKSKGRSNMQTEEQFVELMKQTLSTLQFDLSK